MSFRIENKYEISIEKLNVFYNFLKSNNAKRILVNSIYFDNKYKDSFLNSEEGTVPRKKIRIRYYGSENPKIINDFHLEKKINSYDGKYKTSKKIRNYEKIIKYGIFDELYGLCKPIVNVNYQREYFKIDKFRITFDKNIKYGVFKKSIFLRDLNKCIVEVKTNNLNLDQEINNLFPFKKIRYSKYANSINLLKLN